MPATETEPATWDNSFADFMTIEVLNEQLAVINQNLSTIPNIPTQAARREKLFAEGAQIVDMLEALRKGDRGDNGSAGSASTSLSPTFSPHMAHSHAASSVSASGFTTPDMGTFQGPDPWGLAAAEEMEKEQERIAQELAYVPLSLFLSLSLFMC